MTSEHLSRRWASTKQVADYLGLSTRTVANMQVDGRLKAYRLGGVVRYDLNEIDATLEASA